MTSEPYVPPRRASMAELLRVLAFVLNLLGLWVTMPSAVSWLVSIPAMRASRAYVPVPATLTRLQGEACPSGKSLNFDPSLRLEYRYAWQGQAYTSTNLTLPGLSHHAVGGCAQPMLDALSPVSRPFEPVPVTAYVDPSSPDRAVLIRGWTFSLNVLLGLLDLLLLASMAWAVPVGLVEARVRRRVLAAERARRSRELHGPGGL